MDKYIGTSTGTDDQVFIRGLEEEDVPVIIDWIKHPEFRKKFNVQLPPENEFVLKWLKDSTADSSTIYFAVCLQKSGEVLGICGFNNIDPINCKAEIVLFISDEKAANLKRISETLLISLRFIFRKYYFNKIYSSIITESRSTLEGYYEAGFISEGLLRKHIFIEGEFKDVTRMSILRKDFLERYTL